MCFVECGVSYYIIHGVVCWCVFCGIRLHMSKDSTIAHFVHNNNAMTAIIPMMFAFIPIQ